MELFTVEYPRRLLLVLENIRREIMSTIRKPSVFPSLGPILVFIKDPFTDCFYNWSKVNWDELKFCWIFKNALREAKILLEDTTEIISQNTKIAHDCIKALDAMLNPRPDPNLTSISYNNIDEFLDDEKFKKFELYFYEKILEPFIKIVEEILNLNSEYLRKKGINLAFYKLNPKEIIELMTEITKIAKKRKIAFSYLRKEVTENCNPKECNTYIKNCGEMCEYIKRNPLYKRDEEEAQKKVIEWKKFVLKLKETELTNFNTEETMEDAIKIYNSLPQEIESSKNFKNLEDINMRVSRGDHTNENEEHNLNLEDLTYIPKVEGSPQARYDWEKIKKQFPLYRYTHPFEWLFYGIASEDAIFINNILFIPLKFFEHQVHGQIITILP